MPPLAIRPARPDEAEAIGRLTRAAYAPWADLIGREPLPMGFDHERLIRDHLVDLIADGDEPVAVIEMIARSDDLLIESIAVAPEAQGKGHGGRLLAHAEQVARSRGLPAVRLYTNSRFASNVALYARRGYRAESEEDFAGGTVVHMMRELS